MNTCSFNVFGNQIDNEVSEESKYRYTGQEYNEETDLHNYKARFYDSMLMRFYSVDPAEEQAIPYTYCAINPVMFTDPSGCAVKITGDQSDDLKQRYLSEFPIKEENGLLIYDSGKSTSSTITNDPLKNATLDVFKSDHVINIHSIDKGYGTDHKGEKVFPILGGAYCGNIETFYLYKSPDYKAQQLINIEGLNICAELNGEDLLDQINFEIVEALNGILLNPGKGFSKENHKKAHDKTLSIKGVKDITSKVHRNEQKKNDYQYKIIFINSNGETKIQRILVPKNF